MTLYAVALLFGTRVAETILASVHGRAHPQAGHMDASDLIKALQNTLRGGGRPHMGLVPRDNLDENRLASSGDAPERTEHCLIRMLLRLPQFVKPSLLDNRRLQAVARH